MSGALVLNATYEPLCVVPLRRAVVLVLAEKAIVVEAGTEVMHSARTAIRVPSVVRLSRYVRVPYRREVPLTRRGVLDRDGHLCAYCGARADTVDHVRPRSRGGLHVWTNVVAACARCNHRKGDRLLSELGWHLELPPAQPPPTVAVVMGWAKRDPAWQPYLGASPVPREALASPA
ncbi:HNH endonuclease [Jatrophihabitans cynanchi]|uniref:HNH endonuclease n=1 Tax=Jatrophihabitans cynanchi TaxID=2944128 RepID=A0ABY7K4E3_9ACTN|nr:HNH endonuclease [Jatrophihabitans sp. SB3-54]WAX58141.1 HNH endonuclease [Jatrophihabitans sp. SB3-54]